MNDLAATTFPALDRLRRMAFAAALTVLLEAGLGMVVNLYVTIPDNHAGAHPSDYFSGSFESVLWAISHGGLVLALHAILGIALVFFSVSVVIGALALRRTSITVLSVVALLLIFAAAFNGASFLDFNIAINSLLMALCGLVSIACYLVVTFLVGSSPGPSVVDAVTEQT